MKLLISTKLVLAYEVADLNEVADEVGRCQKETDSGVLTRWMAIKTFSCLIVGSVSLLYTSEPLETKDEQGCTLIDQQRPV